VKEPLEARPRATRVEKKGLKLILVRRSRVRASGGRKWTQVKRTYSGVFLKSSA